MMSGMGRKDQSLISDHNIWARKGRVIWQIHVSRFNLKEKKVIYRKLYIMERSIYTTFQFKVTKCKIIYLM